MVVEQQARSPAVVQPAMAWCLWREREDAMLDARGEEEDDYRGN